MAPAQGGQQVVGSTAYPKGAAILQQGALPGMNLEPVKAKDELSGYRNLYWHGRHCGLVDREICTVRQP
jgi:hypothetical protein